MLWFPISLVYSFQLSGIGYSDCSQLFQHEAGCAAYGDAQKKLIDIQKTKETKTSGIVSIQNELEKNRLESVEARKVEQVCLSFFSFFYGDILNYNIFLIMIVVVRAMESFAGVS